MAGQRSTWDYWLSLIAGVAVLGVAFLPTQRPGLVDAVPLCGPNSKPDPQGCTQLQQAFGESLVATIHYISAAVFILSLAAICFVFARREKDHGGEGVRGAIPPILRNGDTRGCCMGRTGQSS